MPEDKPNYKYVFEDGFYTPPFPIHLFNISKSTLEPKKSKFQVLKEAVINLFN